MASKKFSFAATNVQINGSSGDIVSLIPWQGEVTGIVTTGLKWLLQDETLYPQKTRGISNEMLDDTATVQIKSGLLLIVHRRNYNKVTVTDHEHWRLKNETHHFLPFYFLLLLYFSPPAPPTPAPTPAEPQTITILTHDSFAIGEDVIKAFEADNNAKVVFLQSGDAGSVLNQAVLTKDAPLADVLFGVDNTFLSRALDAEFSKPINRLC